MFSGNWCSCFQHHQLTNIFLKGPLAFLLREPSVCVKNYNFWRHQAQLESSGIDFAQHRMNKIKGTTEAEFSTLSSYIILKRHDIYISPADSRLSDDDQQRMDRIKSTKKLNLQVWVQTSNEDDMTCLSLVDSRVWWLPAQDE